MGGSVRYDFFVLAALSYCGLITTINNGRTIAVEHIKPSGFESNEYVAPGELLGEANRQILVEQCPFLAPSEGWNTFGLRQQRESWQRCIKFKQATKALLQQVSDKLAKARSYSIFETIDDSFFKAIFDKLSYLVEEIKTSLTAREGLERFLSAWQKLQLKISDIDSVKNLNDFLANHLEQYLFIRHYIGNRSVEQAAFYEPQLQQIRIELLSFLSEPLEKIVSDQGYNFT